MTLCTAKFCKVLTYEGFEGQASIFPPYPEKAAIAKAAIPYCNITCITQEEMASALSGYLKVLHDKKAEFVGGKLPGDDFYYCK
jgi:hypothetical protein